MDEARGQGSLFSEYRKTWEYLDRVTWQLPLAAIALALFVGFGISGLIGADYGYGSGFTGVFLWLRSGLVGLLMPSFFAEDLDQPSGFVARLAHPKWLWGYVLVLVGIISLLTTLVLFLRWLAWIL